jgi:hypothetical protein
VQYVVKKAGRSWLGWFSKVFEVCGFNFMRVIADIYYEKVFVQFGIKSDILSKVEV